MKKHGYAPCLVISREEVESSDTTRVLEFLTQFTKDPELARAYREQVDISFFGYDDIDVELCEIPQVREFVHSLDARFPYWLFLLSKGGLGLQCILYCFLLPSLTDKGKAEHHPKQLEQLLVNRWFPAMNAISEFAGLSEGEIEDLTNRAIRYFTEGPWVD